MPVLKLGKTSSFDKRCNIYCHLLAKEYCTQSSHRRINHVLGTLITNGSYTFQKSWSLVSKKHIACNGRFAFFDNYESCVDCSSPCQGPIVKFTLQRSKANKIEDALLMEGCPETLNIPNQGYKRSLLALVKGNKLQRIDLESGKINEEVSIGPSGVRFKKIQWNVVEESFTLYSILTPASPAQVFGRDAVDAAVFLNILMVMHSTNYVRMYSLERILEKNKIHSHKLFENLQDGTQYDTHPSHLTHNIKLEEQPECLFEVRCRNRDVMVTMPPCHYIMWPLGNSNGYCCYSFKTRKMVKGGLLNAEECEFEERVSLHSDDSGRIIHMNNSQLRVLKLQEDDCSDERSLVEDFVIDFKHAPKTTSSTVRVSQFGRVIKPRVKQDCTTLMDRIVLTMDYCEDQDMLLVLSTREQNASMDLCNSSVIGFYDNWNGTLLRQFVLEESLTETMECSVCFTLDTITHVLKTNHGRFECHVYKLQPMMDLQDEWTSAKQREATDNKNQTTRRRQRR